MLEISLVIAAAAAINYYYGCRFIIGMADAMTYKNPFEALTWTPPQLAKFAACFVLGGLWGVASLAVPHYLIGLFGAPAIIAAPLAYYIAREVTDFIPDSICRPIDARGVPATFAACTAIYAVCWALLWALLDFAFYSWENVGTILAAWIGIIAGVTIPCETGITRWTAEQLARRGLTRYSQATFILTYIATALLTGRGLVWCGTRVIAAPLTALLEAASIVTAVVGWRHIGYPKCIRQCKQVLMLHLATALLIKYVVIATVWMPQIVPLWLAMAYTAVLAPRCPALLVRQVALGDRVAIYAGIFGILTLFTVIVWHAPVLAQVVVLLFPSLFMVDPAPQVDKEPDHDTLLGAYNYHSEWFMTSCNPYTSASLQNEVHVPVGYADVWHRHAAAFYRGVLNMNYAADIPETDHLYPGLAARRHQHLMHEIRMAPENVDLYVVPTYENIRNRGFLSAIENREMLRICPPMWVHLGMARVMAELRCKAANLVHKQFNDPERILNRATLEQKNDVSPAESPRRNAIAETDITLVHGAAAPVLPRCVLTFQNLADHDHRQAAMAAPASCPVPCEICDTDDHS